MENNILDNNETNSSGSGRDASIPREIRRFNWGAFFFTWIWGLFNNSFLTLINLGYNVLVVILAFFAGIIAGIAGVSDAAFGLLLLVIQVLVGLGDLILRIWFGARGNVWAWRNKRWKDTAHFNDIQRIWAIVSLVFMLLYVFAFVGIIAAMAIPTLMTSTSSAKNRVVMLRSVNSINQAALMNEALENKCIMTSSGLAKCFGARMTGNISGNTITESYGTEFSFYGDGRCRNKNTCYVLIDVKRAGGTDSA